MISESKILPIKKRPKVRSVRCATLMTLLKRFGDRTEARNFLVVAISFSL